MSRVSACDGVDRGGAFNKAKVRVSYWTEYACEEMWKGFANLAVHRFKDKGFNLIGIPCIADQNAFVTAEIAEVKEVAPCSGG